MLAKKAPFDQRRRWFMSAAMLFGTSVSAAVG